jgi:hypothetical protein
MKKANAEAMERGAELAKRLLNGKAPHPGECGCVLCLLPRGGAWGELELYRRIMRMGGEVHRGMRALGDWILIGSGVRQIPVPAAAAAVTPSGQRSRSGPSIHGPHPVLRAAASRPFSWGLPEADDFDRVLDEIEFGASGHLGVRASAGRSGGRALEKLEKLSKSSTYGMPRRTQRAVLALSMTVPLKSWAGAEVSERLTFMVSQQADRPFKAKYLIITTYQGLDISWLHAGDVVVLSGPLDAALYSPPKWDELAKMEQLERVAIAMPVMSPGRLVKMQMRVREPALLARLGESFEFRAALLGEEVVG